MSRFGGVTAPVRYGPRRQTGPYAERLGSGTGLRPTHFSTAEPALEVWPPWEARAATRGLNPASAHRSGLTAGPFLLAGGRQVLRDTSFTPLSSPERGVSTAARLRLVSSTGPASEAEERRETT